MFHLVSSGVIWIITITCQESARQPKSSHVTAGSNMVQFLVSSKLYCPIHRYLINAFTLEIKEVVWALWTNNKAKSCTNCDYFYSYKQIPSHQSILTSSEPTIQILLLILNSVPRHLLVYNFITSHFASIWLLNRWIRWLSRRRTSRLLQ